MKENLTKLFLQNYTLTVDKFHKQQKAPAADMALNTLLIKFNHEIIEGDLLRLDSTGHALHKAFRNCHISDTDVGIAIWFLIQDAPLYHAVMTANSALEPDKDLTREDYRNA